MIGAKRLLGASLACALVMSPGCSKKNEETKIPAAQRQKAPKPAPVIRFDGLFKKGQVGLPAPISQLKFGTGAEALNKISPALAQGKAWTPDSNKNIQLKAHLHSDQKTLRYVEISLPLGSFGTLEKLWGTPANIEVDGRERRPVWLDEKKGIQAIHQTDDKNDLLYIWPVTTLAQLLNRDPSKTNPQTLAQWIGVPTEKVRGAFPRRLERKGQNGFAAWLSPLPYRTRSVTVFFDGNAGKISRIHMRIDGDETGVFEEQLVKLANQTWGAPKVTAIERVWHEDGLILKVVKMARESHRPRPPRFQIYITAGPAPAPAPANPKP
jgi:hypothetical protein